MSLKKIIAPRELDDIFNNAKGEILIPETREELMAMATGGEDVFNVEYGLSGHGPYREATVTKCKNGIVVNYTDINMRRQNPHSMVIADNLPTDRVTHIEAFGRPFDEIREEAFAWLKGQEKLICLLFYSGGGPDMGYPSILIAPANAAFFAAALADLQGFVPLSQIPDSFKPRAVIYVVPTFRHSFYSGRQISVHNRTNDVHEIFSFNLYPGLSAKNGIHAVLLDIGEQEGWVTLRASCVRVVTPYELNVVIMCEGPSGGGKSGMLEPIERQPDGRVLLAEHMVNGEKHLFTVTETCELNPVSDDMALALRNNNSGKLVCVDAEQGWFVSLDHVTSYGRAPELEKNCIHPPKPLVFINMEAIPGGMVLPWEPVMDKENEPCPNPRVIIPRSVNSRSVIGSVEVDIRCFGLRQPPCTEERPTYGIAGMFHILPPALAWLWRVAAPKGLISPLIKPYDEFELQSEGVGTYWPFVTGKRVRHANLLLEQILGSLETRYLLLPNQYIGSYKVGFSSGWLTREYLARRGGARFKTETLENSRCSLLGYSPPGVKIDGAYVSKTLLHTNLQPDLGTQGYDAGAEMLKEFFRGEVKQYLTPDLHPLGRKIIEACFDDARADDYSRIIPVK